MKFWDSKDKKMIEKEADKIIKEVVKKEGRPFIPPEKPITNLETFTARVKQLEKIIGDCNYNLREYDRYINSLGDPNVGWRLEKNTISADPFYFNSSQNAEIDKAVREAIVGYWSGQRVYYKELIHTCEDELEWLEAKMRFNDNVVGHINYNFDPNKDHA